jgi:putative FmdB family regulatory protein
MPFYEYQCKACGAQVEALQKISDAPLKKCPECGKSQLQKLISAPSFRLAGGGWYETDFKTDKDKKRNLVEGEKAEPKAESSSDAKSAATAETKPEAKAEAKAGSKPESKPESKRQAKPAAKPAAKTAKRKAKR